MCRNLRNTRNNTTFETTYFSDGITFHINYSISYIISLINAPRKNYSDNLLASDLNATSIYNIFAKCHMNKTDEVANSMELIHSIERNQ